VQEKPAHELAVRDPHDFALVSGALSIPLPTEPDVGLIEIKQASVGDSASLQRLNPVLRGWANYYRYCTGGGKVFTSIDWWPAESVRWMEGLPAEPHPSRTREVITIVNAVERAAYRKRKRF
jgi:hypothetical protein